jgi:hypothetical protein
MKDEVQSLAELLATVLAILMGSKQRFHFKFEYNHFCCRENDSPYVFYIVHCWLTHCTTENKREEQTMVLASVTTNSTPMVSPPYCGGEV